MNAAAIIALVVKYGPAIRALIHEYGPELKEIGIDLAKIYESLRAARNSQQLSVSQRLELEQLLDTPAAEWGHHSTPPPIVDFPAPPAADPTSIEYDTEEEAIAASGATPGYPFVIKKGDGKFVIWPVVGPFPGTKVWPEA